MREPTTAPPWPLPPRSTNRPIDLLEAAPRSLAELAEWLPRLTYQQADAVWPAAILEILSHAETDHSLAAMATCLAAVRDQYRRGPHDREDTKPSPHTARVLAIARAAAPNPGDQFEMRAVFPGYKSRLRAAATLNASGEFRVEATRQGRRKFATATRTGATPCEPHAPSPPSPPSPSP